MTFAGLTLDASHILTIILTLVGVIWGYAKLQAKVTRNSEKITEHEAQLKDVRHTLNNERLLGSALSAKFDMMLSRLDAIQEDIRRFSHRD